jgi:gamma-glutamylcyclotransferase (GGCT)/AIG2-like uncharacterized protein YtfP
LSPRTRAARYFFYGTLMDRMVLALVLGHTPPPAAAKPASLDGYRRVFRSGASYPVLVPAPGEVVAGIVVEGLGQGDRRRLEAFEGRDYVLREMAVRVGRGGLAPARVFMPRPRLPVSETPWTPADWRRRYRRQYLQRIARTGRPG